MANTQININANGTTTLATAGKYCDRNIDVNVGVAGKPTQFTNLYDPANVTLQTVMTASSSGVSYATDTQVNVVKIPFHHVEGAPVVLRMRGLGTVRDRYTCVIFQADGTTRVNHYNFINSGSFTLSYDDYGDVMITFAGGIIDNYDWEWFGFNFQYPTINKSATKAYVGPIITINEPIGNGGYAG